MHPAAALPPAVQHQTVKEVILSFPSVSLLWSFVKAVKLNSLLMNSKDKTLACRCSDEQVALAIKDYGGGRYIKNTPEG